MTSKELKAGTQTAPRVQSGVVRSHRPNYESKPRVRPRMTGEARCARAYNGLEVSLRDEIWVHATTARVNLDNVMVSEVSRTQKGNYCAIPPPPPLHELPGIVSFPGTESRIKVSRGGWGGRGGELALPGHSVSVWDDEPLNCVPTNGYNSRVPLPHGRDRRVFFYWYKECYSQFSTCFREPSEPEPRPGKERDKDGV